jgi:hypothetical protein
VGGAKARLEQGLVQLGALTAVTKEVIRLYASETPPTTNDPAVEGAALLLLPHGYARRGGPSVTIPRTEVIHALVSRGGVALALQAFAASLGPVAPLSSEPPPATSLLQKDARYLVDLLGERTDRIVHAYFLGASAEDRAAARSAAESLRASEDLLVRSAMSAAILDPDWIDLDLEECVRTGARAIITETSLLHAGSVSAVTAFLGAMTLEQALMLAPIPYRGAHGTDTPFAAALLRRFGDDGIVALSRWLEAVVPHLPSDGHRTLLAVSRQVLELLRNVVASPEAARAAAQVLSACHGQKIAKNEDPRPAAYETLRAQGSVAIPIVKEATRSKNRAWAMEVLPQLERLAGAARVILPEAPFDEVPAPLRAESKLRPPPFWAPEAFTPPQTRGGKAFPRSAVEALGALLASGDRAAIARVREDSDPKSLAAFAWDLFQAWLSAGAPSKDKWAFAALGPLGNDEAARRLTPLVRAWPGESAHQRAVLGLDVLADIGSDVALMMLDGIAQKLKFKGLQERAREKMEEIANRRGLTAEELADRLVPDLDLEDDGSLTLDFGPRSFRVGFDEALAPYVIDATGTRLRDLPKPNSKDDAELAGTAVSTWKAMKKDARTLAALQILRMELGMSNERRWPSADFEAFLVQHPLLVHLVRRVIWGVFAVDGALRSTFRVAEDRTYADARDEAFELPADSIVGIPHRLVLDEGLVAAWSGILADYELAQPFSQLGREVYRLQPEELEARALRRFEGRVVPTSRVLGLLGRGWHRGPPEDAGAVSLLYKPIARDLVAVLAIENGIMVGAMEYTDPTQTLGLVELASAIPGWGVPHMTFPLSEVSPVIVSEVIRDVEALGKATDAA